MPPLNCQTCHTYIREKQHKLVCNKCSDAFHRTCKPKIHPKDFHRIKQDWICSRCSTPSEAAFEDEEFNQLPFHNEHNIEDDPAEYNHEKPTTDIGPIAAPDFAKGIRIGHLNINSIRNKIDELRIFLMQYSFDVCGITETKLQHQDDSLNYNINGYHLQRFDRTTRQGGGSALYIKEDMKYIQLNYDVKFPVESEVNLIQLFPEHRKPIIVILIYHPPNNCAKQFILSLQSLLLNVENDKVDFTIIGDLNVNLLVSDVHSRSLTSTVSSYGLTQLISEPTRVTIHGNTLLNPIFVSFPKKVRQSGVFSLTNSDHRFVFCVIGKVKATIPSEIVSFRSYEELDWEKMTEEIGKTDWDQLSSMNVNGQLEYIEKSVLDVINQLCPVKRRRIKGISADWITVEVLLSIKNRNQAKHQFDSDPTTTNKIRFNKLRNECKLTVDKAII
jgi:exonuclease III